MHSIFMLLNFNIRYLQHSNVYGMDHVIKNVLYQFKIYQKNYWWTGCVHALYAKSANIKMIHECITLAYW